MVAVVQEVPQTEESLFLSKVEAKFRSLLEQSKNIPQEIEQAADRMQAEGLLWQRPDPRASAFQASFRMIGDNEALSEWWMQIKEAGYWEAAETPQELISALMPSHETLE